MKHTLKVTIVLVLLFLAAQIIGMAVLNNYVDQEETAATGTTVYKQLPYSLERPDLAPSTSYIFIILAILVGTGILLLLIKFKKNKLWKLWFFLSVWLVLGISLAAFINSKLAIVIAFIIAIYKVVRPSIIIQNLSELLMYGGLAAIFVPILNIVSVTILLILISIYDAYAVWHSKHMIKLVEFQTKSKVFAGLFVPYSLKAVKPVKGTAKKVKAKIRTAILGGGDIAFPLLFAGVVMRSYGFLTTLIIPITTALALLYLFIKSEKGKFYPAMPFLTVGIFIGYGIIYFIF